MERRIELPRQARGALVRAASFDESDNSIEVCWTTGATVRRMSWREGLYDEELIVTPAAVRLDRLNAGAPLLNTHADWSLEDVLGSVVPGSAKLVKGEGIARVRLSKAPGDADNVQKIREGIITNISVGYAIHRVEKIEAADGTVPVWRIVDWEPLEISAVPIPADPGAQVRSAGGKEDHARLFAAVMTMSDATAAAAARMRMRAAQAGLV
jgi:hypothetical protein